MPQMAPIMWQVIFLWTTVMLLISVSKNFFSIFGVSGKKIEKKFVMKSMLNWAW